MITLSILILSTVGALVVFIFRFFVFSGLYIANKHKQKKEAELQLQQLEQIEEVEVPLYVYTQLESWAEEIRFKNSLVIKYRESQKMLTYNVKKQEQIGNKIVQLQKQIATAEKNIIVNCEKYNIESSEYLPYNWG